MRETTVRIEGPYYGSYSLARVNRGLATALSRIPGVRVSIAATAAEGWYRDRTTEAQFAKLGVEYCDVRSSESPDIVLRHTWPIESADLKGRLRLRLFPWEETRIPHDIVEQFNARYDAILAPARFVCRALEQSGVYTPIGLLPNATDIPRIAPSKRSGNGKIRFLHISSAFPRKGVDALLEGYCTAFAGDDGVELTLKTFPNPHNEAAKQIAHWQARLGKSLPAICLIDEDQDDEAIIRLIDDHDVQVLPSRGEGFGLLVLEGHLRGKPAIIPRSTALAERFVEGVDFPIESRMAYAGSHVTGLGSLWYEPNIPSLVQQFRRARDMIAGHPEARFTVAKQLSAIHFPDWNDIAGDLLDIGKRLTEKASPRGTNLVLERRRLIIVSSFAQLCGIATYIQHLLGGMDLKDYEKVIILAPVIDNDQALSVPLALAHVEIRRCWHYWGDFCKDVLGSYSPLDGDDLIVQHHTGFFAPAGLDRFLSHLAPHDIQACVMLHSVLDDRFDSVHGTYKDIAQKWAGRFKLLVHSVRERERLANDQVILFPHPFEQNRGYASANVPSGSFMIGSFGFLRPHKGYQELIAAWPRVLALRPGARLMLLASLHPAPDSREELQRCRKLIDLLGIAESVTIHTEFLDEAEIQGVLGYLDGVIFPYDNNDEGASGAIRVAMSSHAAIAASDIELFSEFRGTIDLFSRNEEAIAKVALRMLDDKEYRDDLRAKASRMVEENSYARSGQWISTLLRRRKHVLDW